MSVQVNSYYGEDHEPYYKNINNGYINYVPPVKQFKEQLYVCKRKRDEIEQQQQQHEQQLTKKFKHREVELGEPMKQIKVLVDGLEFHKNLINNDVQKSDMIQDFSTPGNQSGAIILYKAPVEILENSIQKWKHDDNKNGFHGLTNCDQIHLNGYYNSDINDDDDSQNQMEID